MARPNKIGIDYFSHDVDIAQDIKVRLLRAKYGLIGYAIYMRVLEELYKDKGYYLLCDDNFILLFSSENNVDNLHCEKMLLESVKVGLFDNNLFEKSKILTSKRIILNYLQATYKRKIIVLDCTKLPSCFLNDDDNPINDDNNLIKANINYINSNISTQTETETETKSKPKQKQKENKKKYGEYKNVLLSDSEVEKLKNKFGSMYEDKIKLMDEGIELKGYKYKNHYLAILAWDRNNTTTNKTKIAETYKGAF